MKQEEILDRMRRYLGDFPEEFRTSALGDGETSWFDLPKHNVDPASIDAMILNNAEITNLTPADYTLYAANGQFVLNNALPDGQTLVVSGVAYSMFSDDELMDFVNDAVKQHCANRSITERYRDQHGFIRYEDTPMDLENLPEIEEPMLTILAVVEVLWELSTDAATDVDILTAEGTHVNRSQRWAQLRAQIDTLTEKYQSMCEQLNIGLFRIETLNLRRVSRTTGRLVPIFKDREYDDHTYPVRELPPIDHRDDDESGIPSPLWGYPYGI